MYKMIEPTFFLMDLQYEKMLCKNIYKVGFLLDERFLYWDPTCDYLQMKEQAVKEHTLYKETIKFSGGPINFMMFHTTYQTLYWYDKELEYYDIRGGIPLLYIMYFNYFVIEIINIYVTMLFYKDLILTGDFSSRFINDVGMKKKGKWIIEFFWRRKKNKK